MDHSDPFHLFPYRAIVDHPPFAWPNGANVAVWVIPNIEHFHWEIGAQAPDVRNHSRRDYGNRVGIWRLMEVMANNGVRGTVALNGEVGKHYPRIMEECARLKWELMGHGLTNSVMLSGMSRDKESRGHRPDPRDHRGSRPEDAGLARARPDRDVRHARPPARARRRICLRLGQR
jgi:hypothetical protein